MKINELVEGVEYLRGDGFKYKLLDDNLFVFDLSEDWVEVTVGYSVFLNMRFVECEFEPKLGETYWYPAIDRFELVWSKQWEDSIIDNRIKNTFGVYRTEEQALTKARELESKC